MLVSLGIFIFVSQAAFGISEADLKKMPLPNNRIIKITGHPQYPPFVWKEKDKNELTGIAIEILKMAFAEINVKTEIIFVETWGRAQEEVKLGHIDILVPPYKNEERIQFYKFSNKPIFMDETVLFVKKGKKFKFTKLSDLKKYKGVAIINDSFGTEFDNFEKSDLNLTRLNETEQCIKFLEIGRADYVVAGLYSGLSIVHKLKLNDSISIFPKRIIITGMYAPISLKSQWNKPEIEAYLDSKIMEYENKGIIKKLEKKYFELMNKLY
ncbi:MAG: transporter substrate-binding domain-containing protein [Bacteriovorax sp.]|nr:transporter substrate-binding domain-containing protein [Bacteriovorax sp.]